MKSCCNFYGKGKIVKENHLWWKVSLYGAQELWEDVLAGNLGIMLIFIDLLPVKYFLFKL